MQENNKKMAGPLLEQVVESLCNKWQGQLSPCELLLHVVLNQALLSH